MSTLREAAQQALETLEALSAAENIIWVQKRAEIEVEHLRDALAQQAPKGGGNLPPPLQAEPVEEPVAFDADGFRAFVLRELPDGTDIGSGAWWADHLTAWAQRFIKRQAALKEKNA
jgi:hypothetical protein